MNEGRNSDVNAMVSLCRRKCEGLDAVFTLILLLCLSMPLSSGLIVLNSKHDVLLAREDALCLAAMGVCAQVAAGPAAVTAAVPAPATVVSNPGVSKYGVAG